MKHGWKFAVICGLLIVGVVVAVRMTNNPPDRRGADAREGAGSGSAVDGASEKDPAATRKQPTAAENRQALADALGVPVEEIVNVGGVDRPRRDIESSAKTAGEPEIAADADPANAPSVTSVSPFVRVGTAPRLKGDENAQVAGLMAELQQGVQEGTEINKAARSAMFAPEPFELAAYQTSPQTYLDQIRPARVFYPAQPGPDVKPIGTESRSFQQVLQGEKVLLRVKAAPGMPVAFYTPQVGHFDNLLSSYTVAADQDGIATATWLASTGSYGLNDILAASPVHSGQLQFYVDVKLPDGPTGAQR